MGTQELSRALIFERAIGLGWAEGVAFSMVLRINEIVATAVGLVTHALEMASPRTVEVPELERAQTPPSG